MVDALTRNGRKALVYSPTSVMHDVVRAARRIAPSEATVLITGETGTGKEVMARFIHEASGRAGKPFMPMNCGAIPEALLESELFGHVRGAFTGAMTSRKGRLAMVDGGTLFLDEVGELPLALQVKLLRVLQERVYEPVGSNESVPANFRLIAATNRNLEAEVAAGRFRRDLYYRLMVCPIELPALRERQGDVVELFLHFWRARGETRPVEPEALELLKAYTWPGNVRELENLVERLSVLAEGPTVRVEDVPAPVRPGVSVRPSAPPAGGWNPMPSGEAPPPAPPPPREAPPTGSCEGPLASGEAPRAETKNGPPLYADAPSTGSWTAPPASPEAPHAGGWTAPAAARQAAPAGSWTAPPATPEAPHAERWSRPPPSSQAPLQWGTPSAPSAPTSSATGTETGASASAPGVPRAPPTPPPAPAGEAPPRPSAPRPTPPATFPLDLPALLRTLEDEYIDAALQLAGGNKKAAADLLGLQRTTLVEKLRRRQRETTPPPSATSALASGS
jgi:sigma-54 specific flagellar transcriptional regulator A